VTEKIRELIINHATTDEILDQAIAGGMISMAKDGLDKVASGKTTLEEVLRVVQEQ